MSVNKSTKTFGKGSKRRSEDFKKVRDNWDEIDWGHEPTKPKKRRKKQIK